MSISCWCNQSNSDFVHGCAVCSSVARGVTGWPIFQIPYEGSLDTLNQKLKPGRGLTVDQRQLMLVESETIDSELPRAFRSKRGKSRQWSEHDSEIWSEIFETLSIHGNVGLVHLPLPGGSTLFIDGDENVMFVDKVMLEGPLPLLDIAKWLSNSARVNLISDWKWFVIAMSCCMRECKPGVVENWSEWYLHNSWQGLETHMARRENFSPDAFRHPYLRWIKMMEDEKCSEVKQREIIDGNLEIINHQGGSSGDAWNWILSGPYSDMERRKIIHWINLPQLVVVENRFCFLSLFRGKPTATPVIVDPRVWRMLLSWAFEPQESDRAIELRNLFWCWNSEFEKWIPNNMQTKSIRFLRDTVDSLGDKSSLNPEEVNGSSAIKVIGKSGLIYLLSETASPVKYNVRVIPDESMLSEIDERGLSLCIDSQASIQLPPGDVAASYILALHNDNTTQEEIFTMNMLIKLLSFYPNWKNRITDGPNWWDELVERYNPEEDYAEYEQIEDDEGDYWDLEDEPHEVYEEPDLYEEMDLAVRQNVRRIILEQFNSLTNTEQRNQFRNNISALYQAFGGDVSDLEVND